MHGLNVEYRQIKANHSLARKLASDLSAQSNGKAVVVTAKPLSMLSAVRKQWIRIEYLTQIERARTLQAAKIIELTAQLRYMRSLRFSAKPPEDQLEANITFAAADDLVRVPPTCRTLYVTYDFPKEKLHMMTSWMPRGGIVVIYARQ